MKEFPIADLARIIRAKLEYDTPQDALRRSHESRVTRHELFTGVSIDSRTVKTGDCFFAIRGENFDGHDYVPDAFAKGAVCAVVDKDLKADKFTGKTILKVKDTIEALGQLAREYRRQSRLVGIKVVAITGSVGKTTTRQIIHHVLSRHLRVFAAPKNFNNNIGLPLTLLGAGPKDEIIVAELGSNHPGEIGYLTRIARPDIAVITNVHPAHLKGFGDLQTIIREKLSISQGLQDNGVLIINARLASRVSLPAARIMTFGTSGDCDVRARDITFDDFSSRFTIDGTEIILPLAGAGNIENALAAWAVCSRFEISIDDFAQALKTAPTVPMRTEPLQIGRLTVLNDCYNANPASMKNTLGILANLGSTRNRRLVFICGDMAELGRQAEQLHRQLGKDIAQAKVKLLLAVGRYAKIVAQNAEKSAKYDLQTESFDDTVTACNNLAKFIKDNDIILVKGSRTAKLEMTVEKLKELFS